MSNCLVGIHGISVMQIRKAKLIRKESTTSENTIECVEIHILSLPRQIKSK